MCIADYVSIGTYRRTVVGLGNRRDRRGCNVEWSRSAATDAFRMRQIIIRKNINAIYIMYIYIHTTYVCRWGERSTRARLSAPFYRLYVLYRTCCGAVCDVIQSATESRSDILFYFMYYFAPPPPHRAYRSSTILYFIQIGPRLHCRVAPVETVCPPRGCYIEVTVQVYTYTIWFFSIRAINTIIRSL